MYDVIITKHGVLFGKKVEFCCPVCGCEFTNMATDARTLGISPKNIYLMLSVRCPECGVEFTERVSKRDLLYQDQED